MEILRDGVGLPSDVARTVVSYLPTLRQIFPREARAGHTVVVFLGNRWVGIDERVLWPDDAGGFATALHSVVYYPQFEPTRDLRWDWGERRPRGWYVAPNIYGVAWISWRHVPGFHVEHVKTSEGAVAEYGPERVASLVVNE